MKKAARTPLLVLGVALAAGAAVAAVEGMSSLFLLVQTGREARPAPDNFRQAAYDSLLGWVGIPNLAIGDNYGPGLRLTTNAEGIRIHRPIAPALGSGERRVVCSGDSFAFGSGVSDDETFCAALESELPGVRTVNLSQRGFGIDQAYLWYRRDGARYPHQVHLFTFIWHDFERMALRSFTGYPKPLLRLRDGKLVEENVPVPRWDGSGSSDRFARVLADSRLMQLVQSRIDVSDEAKMRRVDRQVWDVAEAVFVDLARLNKERNSQLVLVYLPAPPDMTPGPYDVRRTRMAEFSKRSGIPFVDLTPEMRAIEPDSLDWLFITPNALPVNGSSGHYTAAGNRWVAARLAEHMRAIPGVAAALPAPAGLPRDRRLPQGGR